MLGTWDHENNKPIVVDQRNKHTLDPYNPSHKIEIYKDEVYGWFLEPAKRLIQSTERFQNSFVVLMICMAHIEGIQQYKQGESSNRQSSSFFKESIRTIFPSLDNLTIQKLDDIYAKVRCGLFHESMVKDGVIFSYGFESPIHVIDDDIRINPRLLLEAIIDDFDTYITKLKNSFSEELTDNFKGRYNVI